MDKNYYQVVKDNWRRIFGNRVLWLFALLAIANSIYPRSATRGEFLLLRCVGFIGSIIAMVVSSMGQVGLINIANDLVQDVAPTFKEVWNRSSGYVIKVIVLNLILGFLIVFPLLCFLFASGPDSYQNPLFSFIFWAISILTVVIGTPSACAIVLNDRGIANSLRIGVRIFINRLWDLIALGTVYLILPMLIAICSYFVLDTIGYDVTLPSPLSVSMQSYLEIITIRPIAAIVAVVYFLLYPLWVVLITQLYKDQISEVVLPT